MDIQGIGQIVMLLLGGFLIVGAAVLTSRFPWPKSLVALALGGLLVGTGTFGLPFMEKYQDYFDSLLNLATQGNEKAYNDFFNEVAAGDLPDEVAKLGLAYTLERPLPNMAADLERAITQASAGGKAALLEEAKRKLAAKEAVAEDLVAKAFTPGQVSRDRIEEYDPATQRLMVRPLMSLTPNQREQLQVQPRFLERLRTAGNR